jgi:hypothetical protein
MKNRILASLENPNALEQLYREDPEAFQNGLSAALKEEPQALLLQAWQLRLEPGESVPANSQTGSERSFPWPEFFVAIAVAFLAGTLAKLPQFFESINEAAFFTRHFGAIMASALVAFFCFQRKGSVKLTWTLSLSILAIVGYLNLLPTAEESETAAWACAHGIFLLWSLVGLAFVRGNWRDLAGRMNFIRYNGELLIYSTIMMIGGGVLTTITLGLFTLLDLKIEEWYFQNVGVYGAFSVPIIGSLLVTRVVGNRFRIAPLLAKIFTPLFLVMVTTYLIAMVVNQRSPWQDREFLIAFNALLIVVLGLCVFSISERGSSDQLTLGDRLNIALASMTLIVDVVALSAIIFRLSNYGFTPNRVTVLGANILAFCHLAGILFQYVRFAKKKGTTEDLERIIVRFIPIYNLWGIIVMTLLPVLFGYK